MNGTRVFATVFLSFAMVAFVGGVLWVAFMIAGWA